MATFRQRTKGGTWDYRIVDNNKKLLASRGGFRTKKEAEKEALAIELKLMSGAKINSQASLYELWEEWFDVVVRPLGKSESTLFKHKKRGDLIKELFQDRPATSIRFSQYQRALNSYAERVTKDTVARLNSEIRKVIQFAQRDQLDIVDFTDGAIISGMKKSKTTDEKYIDNTEDYYKILVHLKSHLNYSKSVIPYLLFVSFKTGMRFGEILGLTWDCIDFENQVIHTYRRYYNYKWRPPKTDTSVRDVPVDEETSDVLKLLKKEQKIVYRNQGIKEKENFLFYDTVYGVPSNNAVNQSLQSILKKLEIFPYNLTATGIRHTYASMLLAKGIDIWVVAHVMGHKNIKQVTETYGHLLKEKKEKEHQIIRNLLSEYSLVEQK